MTPSTDTARHPATPVPCFVFQTLHRARASLRERQRHLLTCEHLACRVEGAAMLRGFALFRESGARIDLLGGDA